MTPANRLQTVEEYYFSKKREEILALEEKGMNIINLGIGNPDLPTHPQVTAELEKAASEFGSNYYQSYKGLPELRSAFKNWYLKTYHVELNPETEILPLMGSKEAIMHIHMAFCNPGDSILIPNPGYPTYASTAKLLQVNVKEYNIHEEHDWQPNFEELEQLVDKKTKILWMNYPHMPTGAIAQKETMEQLVAFTKKHQILLVNDNPYSSILNSEPKSIHSFCDRNDPIIELNSLSKSHNMAGWRVGMVSGKAEIINHILKVKSNFDSGMFKPIQKAAIKAMELGQDWFDTINSEYDDRRQKIWSMLDFLGCEYKKDSAGLFVWAKIPKSFMSGEKLSDHLLYEKGIFASPGSIFGSNGKQYIRFSLCASQADIDQSIDRIRQKTSAS